jgi:hypothetical protein
VRLRQRAVESNGEIGTNLRYRKEIKKYKTWVDTNRATLDLHESKYTNTTALKKYWQGEVIKRRCVAETAKQVRQALDQQLTRWEGTDDIYPMMQHPELEPVITQVFDALDDRAKDIIIAKDADPHDDVPVKTLNSFDLQRVLHKLLKAEDGNCDWKNRGLVWSLLSNTMLRWNSGAILRLPNIYVFKDLPPQGVTTPHDTMEWMDPQKEDAGWMLAFIIPPLDQKKKNQKVAKLKSEMVGAYRHKCYYRCVVGLMAMKLLEDLNTVLKISFLDEPPHGHKFWGDVHLFDDSYINTNRGMKEDMLKVDVEGGREVTHLRKCAITLCTAQGLTEDQVSTMSKHRDNNFQKSYRSEISAPVATTLQGFNPNVPWDTYFCPRAHVKLPEKLQNRDNFLILMKWLWKPYEQLQNELKEPHKCQKREKSATHFLHTVIPWLTKVLLQDAPFWMDAFPRNPAVQYFKLQMSTSEGTSIFGENYSQWAYNTRANIKVQVSLEQAKRQATIDANATIIRQNAEMAEKMIHIENQNTELKNQLRQLMHRLDQATPRQDPPIAPQQGNVSIVNSLIANSTAMHAPAMRAPEMTINERLNRGNDEIIPTIFTCNGYQTVKKLVSLSTQHRHDVILKGGHNLFAKNGPLKRHKDRWIKVARILKRCRDHMEDNEDDFATMEMAAEDLDKNERKNMNMNKYSDFISNNFEGKYSSGRKRKQRS